MITAIDTNVLIDLLAGTISEVQAARSALRRAGEEGPLLLPMICYAELAGSFQHAADLDTFVATFPLRLLPLDEASAFLAGRFFREYRRRGGSRTRMMADFIVAAQAQSHADRLLTTDKRFYGNSFPDLISISAEDLG